MRGLWGIVYKDKTDDNLSFQDLLDKDRALKTHGRNFAKACC